MRDWYGNEKWGERIERGGYLDNNEPPKDCVSHNVLQELGDPPVALLQPVWAHFMPGPCGWDSARRDLCELLLQCSIDHVLVGADRALQLYDLPKPLIYCPFVLSTIHWVLIPTIYLIDCEVTSFDHVLRRHVCSIGDALHDNTSLRLQRSDIAWIPRVRTL
jgi:hypothetical protein